LSNALSGFGGVQDRTEYNSDGLSYMRHDSELTSIYTGGGLGRKICTVRPDDMIRSWITFPGDTDGKMLKALDALNIRTHLKDLLTWTELYRGAIMVLGGLDNGMTVAEPLAAKTSKPISFIKVYPASLCLNTPSDLVQDARSPYFEDIELFKIQRRYMGTGLPIEVHASRCIVSKGITVPEDRYNHQEWTYLFWGMGRLQAVFDQMANSDTTQKAFANLIHEATVAVQKIPGLLDMIAGSDEGAATLKSAMDNIARAKSVLNMILLDEGGEFKRDTLSMTGWRDAAMIFREELAAVAE
jgi:phage-related protein (TIGR01555 family)